MNNQSLTSLWSLSSGNDVLCVSSSGSGDQIAVGTDTTCLALDARAGSRDFSSETSHKGRVTAVALVSDGRLLVGGQGVLRLWDIQGSTVLASLSLSDGSEETGDTVLLASQPDGELFGVASENGRFASNKASGGSCPKNAGLSKYCLHLV